MNCIGYQLEVLKRKKEIVVMGPHEDFVNKPEL